MARGTRLQTRNPLKLNAAGDLYIGGTQVTATVAQLNALVTNPIDGVSAGITVAYGNLTEVTGSQEVATGLTTITSVVACFGSSLECGGASAYFVIGKKVGTAGSIELVCSQEDGTTQHTASCEVNWIATGT